MTTLTSAENPTLLDLKNAKNPDGSTAVTIEILHQVNEWIADATMLEGNLLTGHRTVIRTGIPTPAWRQFNQPVAPTKSERAQVTESCGMLEDFSEADSALARLGGDANAFRMNENVAHIEGMAQEASATCFYGNSATAPEEFTGLSPRYNSLSAANGENIISAGSNDTDNGSIWLIGWGPRSCFMMYPKGSMAGLQIKDLGEETKESDAGLMRVMRTQFCWQLGLVIPDWRYVVRIANIEKSALTPDASSGPNLPQLMFKAQQLIPAASTVRLRFYMSRDMRTTFMQQQALLTKSSTLMMKDVGGHQSYEFNTTPVRRCDALAADEAVVS